MVLFFYPRCFYISLRITVSFSYHYKVKNQILHNDFSHIYIYSIVIATEVRVFTVRSTKSCKIYGEKDFSFLFHAIAQHFESAEGSSFTIN